MSPEQVENYSEYKSEFNVGNEKYLDIELGDVDPMALASNQAQNQLSQTQGNNQKGKVDPLELVKGMISTGFSPSKAQLASAATDLSGPQDSSSTWFAIFLQKLLRQSKIRRARR